MARPTMTLSGVVLDSPDAQELSAFYRRLLGWDARDDEPDWVVLQAPDGGTNLSFQSEPAYVRPVWPSGPEQQMMVHLDIKVDDLDAAVAWASAAGATPGRLPAPGPRTRLPRSGAGTRSASSSDPEAPGRSARGVLPTKDLDGAVLQVRGGPSGRPPDTLDAMTERKPVECWLTDMDGVLVHEEQALPGGADFIAGAEGPPAAGSWC